MSVLPLCRVAAMAAVASIVAASPAGAQRQYPFSLTLYDQPDYRGGSLTIYGDNANIGSTGFSTRARSAQVRGTWRLCEGGGFRNRCEIFGGNVGDLSVYGMAGRIGSAQLVGAVNPAQPLPPEAPAPRPLAPARPAPYPSLAEPPAVDAPLAAPGRFARAPATASPAPYVPSRPAPASAPPARPVPVRPTSGASPVEGRSTVFFPAPTIAGADVSARGVDADDDFCRAQGLSGAIYSDQTQRLARAVDIDGRPVGEGPVLRDVLCRR